MIEIKVMKSKAGLENCFELDFNYEEYYPREIEHKEMRTCYQYYTWLFKKHDIFTAGAKGKELIYSIQWECRLFWRGV